MYPAFHTEYNPILPPLSDRRTLAPSRVSDSTRGAMREMPCQRIRSNQKFSSFSERDWFASGFRPFTGIVTFRWIFKTPSMTQNSLNKNNRYSVLSKAIETVGTSAPVFCGPCELLGCVFSHGDFILDRTWLPTRHAPLKNSNRFATPGILSWDPAPVVDWSCWFLCSFFGIGNMDYYRHWKNVDWCGVFTCLCHQPWSETPVGRTIYFWRKEPL